MPFRRPLARLLAAVPGAYVLAALAASAIGALLAWLGMARSEGVVLGAMLGLVLYPLLLLWGLRKWLAWLHTWAGVALGGVLFAVFWMGTLSVFDREIDRWMMPATRLAAPGPVSLDRIAAAVAPVVPAQASQWRVDLPTERVPVLRLTWKVGKAEAAERQLDPRRLAFLPEPGTHGGSGFIFPFHYGLLLKWNDLGKWIVGAAGMAMLLLLVSGVVIHKKIFVQFFTFRPRKSLQRGSLDLHNLTGVLGLPFHLAITLSGLVIFFAMYFPQAQRGAYGAGKEAKAAFTADAYGKFTRPRTGHTPGTPGAMASLDAMAAQAERHWGGGRPYFVRVWHPGDTGSYVELRRSYAGDVAMNLDQIYFDAATGAVLRRFEAGPVMTAQRFVSGVHFVQFRHWPLRWLYFLGGVSGCVLIATGFLFWLQARRARHARHGRSGVRIVEGLAIGSITGVIVATLAFLAANRLLPPDAGLAGDDRAALEVRVFFAAWIACFVHGWWRGRAAWAGQARAICLLATACVLLNAATTGQHPLRAAADGLWAVAGMDMLLLAAAALAAGAARRLTRATGPVRAGDAVEAVR